MIKRVSLQTKILMLVLSLVIFVTVLLTGINGYMEYKQTKEYIGDRALNVATTISLMPEVIKAFESNDPSEILQPIVERIRKQIGAEFIVIGNSESIRYTHPQSHKIGKRMVGGDNDLALIHGQYYKSEAVGSLGPSLRGKAPIFNDKGEIIGIVSVGFMLVDIRGMVFDRVMNLSVMSLIVLGFGVIGGVFLTRSIRKDIMGLEPHEIASLYRDRKAVLRSIKEGIIAIDQEGRITIMNHSARKKLGLTKEEKYKHIDDVLPNSKIYDVLISGKSDADEEIILKDKVVIVNRTPIFEGDKVVGVVASFRDKTEIEEMLNTISEVKSYSEDLRAQAHEYTNKLYVLSGLLQLKRYDEAVALLQEESEQHNIQNQTLFDNIQDQKVQAILLGKIGKASEKKIHFLIDDNSSLSPLPKHITISKLITILGNIIDNALDAVSEQPDKQVKFFATDIGNDIVFEISDNGPGVSEEIEQQIFERGFSTKASTENRGYGLWNVKLAVQELGGFIEVKNKRDRGTVFTIFLPKQVADVKEGS